MSADILKSITAPIKLSLADKEIVKAVQSALVRLGYAIAVDGIPGTYTLNAFNSFKASSHLGEPGVLGVTTAARLCEASVQLITSAQAAAIFGRMPTPEQMTDLNRCLVRFEINTKPRLTRFISQIAHESGGLKWMKELASGEAYEGRRDLGNTVKGDGRRFKG